MSNWGDELLGTGEELLGAAEDYAQRAAKELETDPLGFVAKATGTPDVSIDTDDSDGSLAFKYKSVLTDIDAKWEDGKGSSVSAQAGADLGPAPLFKSKLTTDAEGEVTELGVTAKATIPIEGVLATGEASTGYVKTDDGFKANYSYSAGAQVDGVSMKGGTHGAYEDLGDRGFTVAVGPHGSVGLGAGEIADGFDAAEGEAKISNDVSYGEVDGQTSYGVKNTSELEGKVLGQTVASGKVETGAIYTTGPNGEQIVLDQRYSGQLGNDQTGSVSGFTDTSWTVGVDGDGNEIDRITSTAQGTIGVPGETPITASASSSEDNATGIFDLVDPADPAMSSGGTDQMVSMVEVGPAVLEDDYQVEVGPAVLEDDYQVEVGPAVLEDDYQVEVGPAVLEDDYQVEVGPAVLEDDYQVEVGPAVLEN